jgi:4-carboxymuconolactone decarboxylase
MKIFLILVLFASGISGDLRAQSSMKTANQNTTQTGQILSASQQAIVTISAFTARGDIPQLQKALNQGLDAGLSINETKEILVQLYAYAGFPRSLNALQAFSDVLNGA